ncbi:MAG TPA: hypothetical protein DD730_12700 [Desulfosporosinus sp.]|jgi:hypothetical protein|nr:hypothetical protein [Desulfosporosinus sp.]
MDDFFFSPCYFCSEKSLKTIISAIVDRLATRKVWGGRFPLDLALALALCSFDGDAGFLGLVLEA